MNVKEIIDVITKHMHTDEIEIEKFVNENATFYFDIMTQHAEFYFKYPEYHNEYDFLIERRNKMRTAIQVLEELKAHRL